MSTYLCQSGRDRLLQIAAAPVLCFTLNASKMACTVVKPAPQVRTNKHKQTRRAHIGHVREPTSTYLDYPPKAPTWRCYSIVTHWHHLD